MNAASPRSAEVRDCVDRRLESLASFPPEGIRLSAVVVTPDQMYKALPEGRVSAVVFGAPVLLYYASHQGSGLVRVVGAQFNTLPVAMFFPARSPLRKRVHTALTALRENGTYQRLYKKWFGSE